MQMSDCGLIFSEVGTRKSMKFSHKMSLNQQAIQRRFIVCLKLLKFAFNPNLIFFRAFHPRKLAIFLVPPIRLFASPRKRTTMKEKRSNEVIISMPMPVNQIFSIMERENVMKFFRSLPLQTFFTFSGLGFFIFSRFINSRHYHRLLFRNQMLLLRLCVYIKKISMNIKFQLLFASRVFPFK